jgi:putative ABC transport system permease protein
MLLRSNITMGDLLFDLRDSLRGFRRNRLFAAAVVGTLTLGATTAVFSIVNGVLLRPLAYREAQRLVSIREIIPQIAKQYPTLPANARHFDQWRSRATSFAAIAELDWRTTNLTGTGEPAQIVMLRASGTLFDVLQTPVALGRPLTQDDERPRRPDVVVISQGLWRDRLGHDPAVLGRSLTLGGTPHTIVGVMPAAYELPTFDTLSESGSLTSKFDAITPMRAKLDQVDWMGQFNFPVIARLKPGTSLAQARAELDVLQQSIARIAERETHEDTELRGWIAPLDESIVGRARLGLLLLLGAIGGVVLIACSNLANLSLTRTLSRLRDAAVRSALGASSGRLVRQVIVEQLVLAVAGGALGVAVALEALNLFVRTAPIDLPRVSAVVIDGRVLAFAAVVTIAAGLAVALLPAWRLNRHDVQGMLRAGDRGATDRGGLRTRAALLAVQVAVSVTLLVMTGLFVTSFLHLLRIDPGFSTDHVIAVEIKPTASRYPDAKSRSALYDRILDRVHTLPDISSAAWTSMLPLNGETWVDLIARLDDTRPTQRKPSANYRFIGPDYFRTLSMPLLKGRSIEERDRMNAVTPAVISARAAQTLWPGQDAVGRQFRRGDPDQHLAVVGVVADGHPTASTPTRRSCMCRTGSTRASRCWRPARRPTRHAGRRAAAVIREVDPKSRSGRRSAPAVVEKALEGRRYQIWLFVAFGLVAIVIATIGVYATTAWVARRRDEHPQARRACPRCSGWSCGRARRRWR